MSKISPVYWAALFAAGMVVGANMPRHDLEIMYGWKIQRILPPDSWAIISPATGPQRIDWCPESRIAQYDAQPGYVLCRVEFVDTGCLTPKNFTWVKNDDANLSTATLSDMDTFQPWPKCIKDEEISNAR